MRLLATSRRRDRNCTAIVTSNVSDTTHLQSAISHFLLRSVERIGCIHTCQRLEVDYMGVIVGCDLIAGNGEIVTPPERRSRQDKSIEATSRPWPRRPSRHAPRMMRSSNIRSVR
jgi:DUF2075 family protein